SGIRRYCPARSVRKHSLLRRLARRRRSRRADRSLLRIHGSLLDTRKRRIQFVLTDSILTLTTFVPTAGAVVVALLPRKGRVIQWWTLLVSLVTFLLTLHLPFHYVYGKQGFQFEENAPWIASPKIGYHLGVDGLSMWLVVLTGFLSVIGVLASW